MEASLIIPKQSSNNILLQEVFDNLDNFLSSINSLKDAYYCNDEALTKHLEKQRAEFDKVNAKCTIKEADGVKTISVPNAEIYRYQKLEKNVQQAERAKELVPPSYLVALVSAYDAFFAGIVRSVYNINPKKLQDSDIQFTYRDLSEMSSLKDVKKVIVDKKIDSLLRDSHVEQLGWLAKALSLSTLKKFDGYADFVEITQRRNLFTHTDGIVSDQYVAICKDNDALLVGIAAGAKLDVTTEYFDKAYSLLYRVGIMLTFTMLNVLFKEGGDEDKREVDKKLINYIYDMIYAENYSDAIIVSEFALSPHFKHNHFNQGYYVLNLAQSHKWQGNHERCLSILSEMDWTACTNELLLPKYALVGEYEKAYKCMEYIGKSNDTITPSAYREWPIFKEFRKEERFEQTYEKIFGEPFGANAPLIIETDVPTGAETQIRGEKDE